MSSTRREKRAFAFALCICAITLFVSGCREDMHNQPKLKAYREGADRNPVEGTVARGSLKDDALIPASMRKPGGALPIASPAAGQTSPTASAAKDVNAFPFAITPELLARGQDRFNAYCTPCHSKLGDGNGMIVQRGFRRPPSYHEERLRNEPTSHFFDVMTNGFGAMPSYSDKLSPEDRWKVAAYIRVLQLSQRASIDDVPPAERAKLESTTPDTKPQGGGQHQ